MKFYSNALVNINEYFSKDALFPLPSADSAYITTLIKFNDLKRKVMQKKAKIFFLDQEPTLATGLFPWVKFLNHLP
jgi:hypothetical protein